MAKLISQGAEAKIFLEDGKIRKHRFRKSYRIGELDDSLRKLRTRSEAKILGKLQAIHFPSPRIISADENGQIVLEHIGGKLLREILSRDNCEEFGKSIGEKVAILHSNNIIHGDLTTSNMIFSEKDQEIYFIDFGLSYVSLKEEDRAVDLHVLKEALESKHCQFWEGCFDAVLKEYQKKAGKSGAVLKRLEAVEKRGRYRAKKGS